MVTGLTHVKVVDTVAHPDDSSPVVGSDWNANHQVTADFSWGNFKITSLGDPASAQDAATKNYVDLTSQGVQWKAPVRVATVSAGTLATSFANGQTVDGVTLATGDRILIKNQATQTENGIYIVAASGAPTRSTDADTGAELKGSTVFALEGTVNTDTAFINTNTTTITIGVTNITYVQFTGAAQITAGNGLSKSGNTLTIDTSITMDLSSTQTVAGAKTFALAKISGAGAGVSTIAYANSGSSTTFTIPATTGTAALLAQLTDGSTITGLVNAQFASGCALAFSKLAALTSAHILLGNGSNVATDTAVSGDVTIDNTGVTAIGASKVTNTMLAGSIAPSKITGTAAILGANTFTAAQTVTNILNSQTTLTPSGSVAVDFSATNDVCTLANGATATLTITASNYVAGATRTIIISNGSTAVTSLTLPAWVFVGAAAPTTIAANKTLVITVYSTGTTAGACVASTAAQP